MQRDERVLVVWSYHLDTIIPTCRDFEEKLIKLVWDRRGDYSSTPSVNMSHASSDVNLTEKVREASDSKETSSAPGTDTRQKTPKRSRFWGLAYFVADKSDVEKVADGPSPRPVRLFAPVYGGLGAALSICESSLYGLTMQLTGQSSLRGQRS